MTVHSVQFAPSLPLDRTSQTATISPMGKFRLPPRCVAILVAFLVIVALAMVFPQDLFARAGAFDATYVNGFEDMELCLRVGELGFEVHFCHDCLLYHLESVSEGRGRFEGQNARVFHERWRSRLRPDGGV